MKIRLSDMNNSMESFLQFWVWHKNRISERDPNKD